MTQQNVNSMLEVAMARIAQQTAAQFFPGMVPGQILSRRGQLARLEGFNVRLHLHSSDGRRVGTVYLGQSIDAKPVMIVRNAARLKGVMRWAKCTSFLWPNEVAEWRVVDPSLEPARSVLADMARRELPAACFHGDPEDQPGNPNGYGDAG